MTGPRPIFVHLDDEWDECMAAAARLEPHLKDIRQESYAEWCRLGNFAVSCPAEMAFGKWIGERPNSAKLQHGDPGWDFRISDVDTKGTPV